MSLILWTTWEMSLQLLDVGEEHKQELQDVLTLFAFFHPIGISETLFSGADVATSLMTICWDNGRWNHMKFECVVVQMQEKSLIQFSCRNANEIVVSLHPMVAEWLCMRCEKDLLWTFLKTATSHPENYLNSTA